MSKPEQITFTIPAQTKVVELVDADGVAIREGAVLRNIEDKQEGVVVKVLGNAYIGKAVPFFASYGDIEIKTSHGCSRFTSMYNQWRHVPEAEQTYNQRYLSWLHTHFEHDEECSQVSRDEALAMSGIIALLPPDAIDYEHGTYPTNLEEALEFMTDHLEELKAKIPAPAKRRGK